MNRFLVLAIIGVAIGLGVVLGMYKFQQPAVITHKNITDSKIAIGGDFTLIDQFGVSRSTNEFRGKILLVYFGYTYCPDVCPMALEHVTKALHGLGRDRDKVIVAFVSVDPARDTCDVLKLYSTNFDPNIIMFTGTQEAVENAMSKYKIYAKKETKEGFSDYLINHTSVIYLMGTKGNYISSFAHSTSPEKIQEILLREIRNHFF
jgi:cytochrome oxidase Cu insertion factor (SCO1/SenC/PrrC family)